MRWHLETWRKLYVRCPPSWLRLSVSARGLGSELLKYCDEHGAIDIGDDAPGVAIAYLLGARPREHKRISEDVAELLRDGYLVHEPGGILKIRNFCEAQDRTPGAQRTAAWRARRDAGETSPKASHVTSRVTQPVTSQDVTPVTTFRSDPIRHDPIREDPPVGPPSPPEHTAPAAPAVAVADPPKSTPVKAPRGTRCPSSVDPDAADWCRQRGIPEPRGEVARMLDHFAAQPGQRGVKTDWGATWRNWERRSAENPYGSRYGAVNGTRTRQQLGLQGADAGGEY